MGKLIQRLKTYWFSPMPAERLALLRIFTAGFALWYITDRFGMLQRIAAGDVEMFEPVGLFFWLDQPMSTDWFSGLLWLTLALNIAYLLGWKHKWTGPLFALTLLALLTYRNSWSMIYHNRIALVVQVFVIGFAAAGDRLSVDTWWKNRRGQQLSPAVHWQYGWPIRLLCVLTVATYFLAGYAKLEGSLALEWMTGEAMRSQIAVDALRKEVLADGATPFLYWLYPKAWLFGFLAIGTMILELFAPLFLIRKRLSVVWAILTWLMHWGIFFIMGIRFRYQMTGIIFLPFFEIEKVGPWLKKRFSSRRSDTLSRDG